MIVATIFGSTLLHGLSTSSAILLSKYKPNGIQSFRKAFSQLVSNGSKNKKFANGNPKIIVQIFWGQRIYKNADCAPKWYQRKWNLFRSKPITEQTKPKYGICLFNLSPFRGHNFSNYIYSSVFLKFHCLLPLVSLPSIWLFLIKAIHICFTLTTK